MRRAVAAVMAASGLLGGIPAAAQPDLGAYELVFRDDFSAPLAFTDGLSGPWSATPRRQSLFTNSPVSVFLSGTERDAAGNPLGLDPIQVEDGVLGIGAGFLPDAAREALAALAPAEAGKLGAARYYTGMLATDQTWSQTYGYFEIRARIPRGKGHWPAFWLAPAGIGWPPEIDVFEAYGKGLRQPTPKDDSFSVAVFFDAIDAAGNASQRVDLDNPHAPDAGGKPSPPRAKPNGAAQRYSFDTVVHAADLGADIYDRFWTWAAEWTPEEVRFYFGPSRDRLRLIYATPTPPDVTTPMYAIINDQIGSRWGWNPVPGEESALFAPGNRLEVDSVALYVRRPTTVIAGGTTLVAGSGPVRIVGGAAGGDQIVTGPDLALVDLSGRGGGGNGDAVFLARGTNNAIVRGFGCADRLVLEGFDFQDAAARLRQVGPDTWVVNGAYPADPQTVILRGVRVEDVCRGSLVSRWPRTPDIWSSVRRDPATLTPAPGAVELHADPMGSKLSDGGARTAGPVTLVGSGFGDRYTVGRSDTRIVEAPDGGVDTVLARVSYALPANVENLTGAPARDNARRTGLVLTGNDANNRVTSAGDGAVLAGGRGDDLIDLGPPGKGRRIVASPGDGHDTVIGFRAGDRVALRDLGLSAADAAARLLAVGSDVVLDLGAGQSITFRDPGVALGPESFETSGSGTAPAGHGFDPLWRPNAAFAAGGAALPEDGGR